MPGSNNRIQFANGYRLEPSAAEEWQLMQDAPNTDDVSCINYSANPEGVIAANPSSICHDHVNGNIYRKATGTGVTGWVLISSGTDLHVARYIVSAGGATDGANYTTIATAYAAAVGAGAPQTVFVQPGTYVENITLTAGINICAFNCDALTPNVTINGKLTLSTAGSVSVSGLYLKTNGDYVLVNEGAGVSILNVKDCFIEAFNFNPVQFTNTNASSEINLVDCQGDKTGIGIRYFAHSSDGTINIQNCYLDNTSADTTTASIISNGKMNFINSFYGDEPLEISSDHVIKCRNSTFLTAMSLADTSSLVSTNCSHGNGQAGQMLSCSATATLDLRNCTIWSTFATAIGVSNVIRYSGLTFRGSSTILKIGAASLIPLVQSNDAIEVATPGAYPYTITPQDAIIKVDTSLARTINLPSSPVTGQKHIIKDTVGSAAANNITVTPAAGNIDGAASKTISSNYGAMQVVYTGSEWSIC